MNEYVLEPTEADERRVHATWYTIAANSGRCEGEEHVLRRLPLADDVLKRAALLSASLARLACGFAIPQHHDRHDARSTSRYVHLLQSAQVVRLRNGLPLCKRE